MPGIVMHHHFGKVVYSALAEDIKNSIDKVNLYDFATTGPNCFSKINFFNSKIQKENNNFSEHMHSHKTKEFILKMIEIARVDYNMFNYLAGFITHYYLDVFTNPYIFYSTGIYDVNDESTLIYRGMREKLEIAMDCYVIENYYDANSNAFPIANKILKLNRFTKNSRESIDRLFSTVYGRNDGYKYMNSAIRWQKLYYFLTYDRFGLLDKILKKKDDGKSITDLSQISYYNKRVNLAAADIFNLKHFLWNNPVDKDIQTDESFFDLFDKAKKITVECISDLHKYIFYGESFDFDYYFKDLSYYTGFPCAYNLEMKYFDNIFKKDLF